MGTKTWNVKLVLDDPENREALERTLLVWNDGCRDICLSLLALRRGEHDDIGKLAWEYISKSTKNWHLVFWLTAKPKPTKLESEDVKLKLKLAKSFVEQNGGFDTRLQTRQIPWQSPMANTCDDWVRNPSCDNRSWHHSGYDEEAKARR